MNKPVVAHKPSSIPATSPRRYMTGMAPLNIPSPENTGETGIFGRFSIPLSHEPAGSGNAGSGMIGEETLDVESGHDDRRRDQHAPFLRGRIGRGKGDYCPEWLPRNGTKNCLRYRETLF